MWFNLQPRPALSVNAKFMASHSSFVASSLEIVVDSGCSTHMVPDTFVLSDESAYAYISSFWSFIVTRFVGG
jgi:hypothetical protein